MEEMSLNEWELELQAQKKALEACQKEKSLKSCLACVHLNNCEIRDAYVHAVYNSMSKGAGGGFEF
ncbi:MAG: hypothetical protein KU29_10970 [Sulfurovum sp. FS06-10]|jgi:hypothetical protein|nr:MAG: hypothetical protein KU29_10970 [Sulfurovum sp. FS06-10]